MTTLRLRLQVDDETPIGRMNVIGNVIPANRDTPGELRKRLRGIFIPASDDPSDFARVERVPDGEYLVEVRLPSGEIVRRDVHVPSTGRDSIEVVLRPEAGHERLWSSTSFVAAASSKRAPTRSGRFTARWAEAMEPAPLWSAVGRVVDARLSGRDAATQLTDGGALAVGNKATSVRRGRGATVYRFGGKGAIAPGSGLGDGHEDIHTKLSHRCVLVRDGRDSYLVRAPVPWYAIGSHEEIAFDVAQEPDGDGPRTTVRDPDLAPVLGYLTTSALGAARLLVDRARDMLFMKISNPLGAAAGAYVLVATETRRDSDAWKAWVRNLRNWFPWIPDGSIAFATMMLNHQESDEDVNMALDALLEAHGRGIPFFSLGLRWLLDGLTTFADAPEYESRRDEIKRALRQVSRVARRTDYRQPFTTITLSQRRR